MRFSLIQLTPKRGLSADEAGIYLGCRAWFDRALKAGWFKAVHNGKEKRYDIDDIDACWNRFKKDEWPE
jgi:hypothetical protein